MRTLDFNEMENVNGGNKVASFICSAGFVGYWGIIEGGFYAAGVATGGIGFALGLGVGLIGAAVCSQA